MVDLTGALTTFKKAMNTTLALLLGEMCTGVFNDIFIYIMIFEKHCIPN
jgi:hypothetical protein